MSRVLLTGMPGAGKSSALAELDRRGYRVVDTDDSGWCEYQPYAPRPSMRCIAGSGTGSRDAWRGSWTPMMVARLFVAGRVANQSTFYDRFDAVVLLSAPVACAPRPRSTEDDECLREGSS